MNIYVMSPASANRRQECFMLPFLICKQQAGSDLITRKQLELPGCQYPTDGSCDVTSQSLVIVCLFVCFPKPRKDRQRLQPPFQPLAYTMPNCTKLWGRLKPIGWCQFARWKKIVLSPKYSARRPTPKGSGVFSTPSVCWQGAGLLNVEGAEETEHGVVQWQTPPEHEKGSRPTLGSPLILLPTVQHHVCVVCHAYDVTLVHHTYDVAHVPDEAGFLTGGTDVVERTPCWNSRIPMCIGILLDLEEASA